MEKRFDIKIAGEIEKILNDDSSNVVLKIKDIIEEALEQHEFPIECEFMDSPKNVCATYCKLKFERVYNDTLLECCGLSNKKCPLNILKNLGYGIHKHG